MPKGPKDAWLKSATSFKAKLAKEIDNATQATQALDASNKPIATPAFVKISGKHVNVLEKCRAKLIKKLAMGTTANESTFKGSKNAWTEVITECDEATYLFAFNFVFINVFFMISRR